MPICEGCGGSYLDTFKFCPYCGRAKKEPDTLNVNIHVTSDDVWETCEICLVEEPSTNPLVRKFTFEATAIGPQGKYGAAWSEELKFSVKGAFLGGNDYRFDKYTIDQDGKPLPILDRRKCEPKVDVLISKLTADGWESIGRGMEWFSQRFRRKVRS